MMRLLSLVCAVVLLASTENVRAEEPSLIQMEQARELYQEGAKAQRQGRYADAEVAYRGSYDAMHNPSVLADLALVLEKQRKWRAAAEMHAQFLAESPGLEASKRAAVERRMAEIHDRSDGAPDAPAGVTAPAAPAGEGERSSRGRWIGLGVGVGLAVVAAAVTAGLVVGLSHDDNGRAVDFDVRFEARGLTSSGLQVRF